MAKRARNSRASAIRPGNAARADRPEAAPPEADPREDTSAGEGANQVAESGQAGDDEEIAGVVQDHAGGPQEGPRQAERQAHGDDMAANLEMAIRLLRQFIINDDETEMPFARVVGGIVYTLTVEGGKPSCTATPIIVVLLLFLREHLEPIQRQPGTTRQTIDVTEWKLQRLIYHRLEKLTSRRWGFLQKSERRGFQVTGDGRFVFHGWPEGIQFDPRDPDLWRRRRSPARGGGRRPGATQGGQ